MGDSTLLLKTVVSNITTAAVNKIEQISNPSMMNAPPNQTPYPHQNGHQDQYYSPTPAPPLYYPPTPQAHFPATPQAHFPSTPQAHFPSTPQAHFSPAPQAHFPSMSNPPASRAHFQPTPNLAASWTRQLNLQNSNTSRTQTIVIDSLTNAPLYAFEKNPAYSSLSLGSEPHIVIHSCNNNEMIGTIRFHSMLTENIDLTLRGHPISFTTGTFTSAYQFESLTPGHPTLRWKNHNLLKGGKLKCNDPTGKVVANIRIEKWDKKAKVGKIQLLGQQQMAGGMAMDEIVISAIAIAELRRRRAIESKSGQAGVDVASVLAG